MSWSVCGYLGTIFGYQYEVEKMLIFSNFFNMLITILDDSMQLCNVISYTENAEILLKLIIIRNVIEGRLYESAREVNKG